MNTVVVGAGAWGTAFARVLAERGHEVTLAARDPKQAREIVKVSRDVRALRGRARGRAARSLAREPAA